ncbi:MAG: acylphosphatase [Candidatus Omnitrophota bacterium]
MNKKILHIYFSGRVQGVGFRYTAEYLALSYGLTGWVKNLDDGRVEAVCVGGEKKIKSFLEGLRSELGRYIRNEEAHWAEATGEFQGFKIRFH